jgi:hypothetical protein
VPSRDLLHRGELLGTQFGPAEGVGRDAAQVLANAHKFADSRVDGKALLLTGTVSETR